MEYQLFKDQSAVPDNAALESALGKAIAIFTQFQQEISGRNLVLEWRYYNDGKSWLGKILNKKKNLAWLSVWNTGFKLTFYFTEKTMPGVQELEIDDAIKSTANVTGKLRPVMLLVSSKKALSDALTLLDYKKGLK